MSSPTGCRASMSRTVWTIDVAGWCSTKARAGRGMVCVATNAELTNGRKMSGWANAPARSDRCHEVPLRDLLDRGGREQPLKVGEGAVHDDPIPVEYRDPVGRLLGSSRYCVVNSTVVP